MQKITKILSLVFLITSLASCTKTGCVVPEAFDTETVVVQANPTSDGIAGTYNSNNGGQRANWHDTGLKTDGTPLIIAIAGGWGPWGGDVGALQRCDFCAIKDPAVSTALGQTVISNCICYDNNGINPVSKREFPSPENAPNGTPRNVDCSLPINQNDPAQCSCTKQNGKATDYGVYHIPLNYEDKNSVVLVPDLQSTCKYDRGMGLYLGLFGSNGAVQPTRLYHLFSEEEICDVGRNASNQCLDANGNDATQYVFRSANSKVPDGIVKDDEHNNDGSYIVSPPNDPNVIYHTPNEEIKVMIYDSYYSDNSGSYTLTFLGGVNNGSTDNGIIQYLVKIVEDSVLGTFDKNGIRQGGLIQFFFTSIVNDNSFILILQFSLSLYILFFGVGTLIGVVEINRKELMSRIVKIGLVMFFITQTGWYFYNEIVVKFFQNGMNSVIAMFMSMSDSVLDKNTSDQIYIANMGANGSSSNALRFAYPDLIIKKLISTATTQKVWGLFFSNAFGWLYIVLFYASVAGFIGVMLYAATIYLLAILKLSLVLAMGPIFICFTLFAQTNEMFKKWLAFLGARSLEIVFLFLILYSFLYIIDTDFTNLLYVKTCYTPLFSNTPAFAQSANPFQMIVLKTQSDKSFIQWIIAFIKIGGLIFILKLVIDKMPHIAQSLIDIGGGGSGTSGHGVSDDDRASQGGGMGSSADLARQLLGNIGSLAKKAATQAAPAILTGAVRAGDAVARATGLSSAVEKLSDKIPFSGPRAMARNAMIGKIIDNATKSADQKGLTGQAREQAIRSYTLQAVQTDNSKAGAFAGIGTESALKMLDKKLVADPLRAKIKEFAKQLKQGDPSNIPFGKNMDDQIKAKANDWADQNLVGGRDAIQDHLKDLKGFMSKQGELSTSEAAKKFANNPEMQNKYLQHLKDHELTKAQEKQKAANYQPFALDDLSRPGLPGAEDVITNFASSKILNPLAKAAAKATNAIGRAVDTVKDDVINNPKSAAASFIRKSKYAEERKNDIWSKLGIDSNKGFNPFRASTYSRRINAIDKDSAYFRNQDFANKGQKADKLHALSYGIGGGYEAELKESENRIKSHYQQQIDEADGQYAKKLLIAKRDEKIIEMKKNLLAKKEYYFEPVKKQIENDPALKTQIAEIKPLIRSEEIKQREERTKVETILEMRSQEIKQKEKEKNDEIAEIKRFAERNQRQLTEKEKKYIAEIRREYAAKYNEWRKTDGGVKAIEESLRQQNQKDLEVEKTVKDIIKTAETEYQESSKKAEKGSIDDKIDALEKQVRLEYLKRELEVPLSQKLLDINLDKISDISKKELAQVNQSLATLDTKVEELSKKLINGTITEGERKILEASIEEFKQLSDKQGLLATELKVEFGASISDALLKKPDFLLQECNILLGVPDHGNAAVVEAAKTILGAQKYQFDSKLRMAKIDKRIKQMEKHNLESELAIKLSDPNTSHEEKTRIKTKLEEVTLSLTEIEREEKAIESQVNELANVIKDLG